MASPVLGHTAGYVAICFAKQVSGDEHEPCSPKSAVVAAILLSALGLEFNPVAPLQERGDGHPAEVADGRAKHIFAVDRYRQSGGCRLVGGSAEHDCRQRFRNAHPFMIGGSVNVEASKRAHLRSVEIKRARRELESAQSLLGWLRVLRESEITYLTTANLRKVTR